MPAVPARPAPPINSAPPIRLNPPEEEQIDQLVKRLLAMGADPAQIGVAKAPLRISPLGAHIDHQLGIVTGMTIDQSVLLAFAPAQDASVHIESLNFAGAADFSLDGVPPAVAGDWANYIRGVVNALRLTHDIRRGMIGVVGGKMPIGGLSSSAAVTTAYLLALESVNELDVTQRDNVELSRMTENDYIGLRNGILDQSVILYGEHGHLTRIDCETVTVDNLPAPVAVDALPFEVLVIYSGVTHALTGTDYNNRVAQCQDAARMLLEADGATPPPDARLRHVNPTAFDVHGETLPAPLYRRAKHYFGEMDRVAAGELAWSAGDIVEFGRQVNESGESSVKWYECGSPQLITLYETLRDAPGVYGTRFSGAGFRGSCIALVDPQAVDAIADAVHAIYPRKHADEAERYSIHVCETDGHARLLESPSANGWARGR